MSKKLTPEELFGHVKAIYPDTVCVRVDGSSWTAWNDNFFSLLGSGTIENVDWPEGVTEWSSPPPKWETPVLPFDWGKECEFSDNGDGEWKTSVLTHFGKWGLSKDEFVWGTRHCFYRFCRIDRNRYPLDNKEMAK